MSIVETMARAIHGPAYHGEMEARDRDPILVALQTQPIQAALRAIKPSDISDEMVEAFMDVRGSLPSADYLTGDEVADLAENTRRALAAAIAAGAEQ